MLSPKQLFKAGRTKKILEVKDDLQVNDFFNETGYINSNIHGRMSRITFTIIDITKGKKDKANVVNFKFTTKEFKEFAKALSVGGIKFSQYCRQKYGIEKFIFCKANSHKKIKDKFIEIRKISVSYEAEIRNDNKWKVRIVEGMAIPAQNNFGYDNKTYKDIIYADFYLSNSEIMDMAEYVSQFINWWEFNNFNIFLNNRSKFIAREKMNDYDEENMNWNSNPNYKKLSDNSGSKLSVKNTEIKHCKDCNEVIDENLYKITVDQYGKGLCLKCVKKY